ncbi:MAG: 5-oxoprolinase/urea amidolyase family protein [Flaviflexus sp.]|nr:5-oxoprolinase/urea amidolyase family protein [Flaviflexus sp.]
MSAPVRLMGTRSLLVELGDIDTVMAWHAHLTKNPLPGQLDVIAAARTILIKTATRRACEQALHALDSIDPEPLSAAQAKTVEIPTCYDGEDLAAVAEHYGISTDALIEAHTSEEWFAAFGGFAPGFAYCTGGERWDTPRRDTPRSKVPAGSVALAGPFSAVYPQDSPGGWQLLGRTDTAMWDLSREVPHLLHPGDLVRYVAVREVAQAGPLGASSSTDMPPSRPIGRIEATGLSTLYQDLGRTGYGDAGVSASGVLDRSAARQGNRLVGNPATATVLENLLGGLTLQLSTDVTMAITGAEVEATITVGEETKAAPLRAPFVMPSGGTLTLGQPSAGVRCYVAARGGFAAPRVLGSTATDTMSRLGPAPLSPGDPLKVRTRSDLNASGEAEPSTLSERTTLRIVPGPRADWCVEGEVDHLCDQEWVIGPSSNRTALRLEAPEGGRPLIREDRGELASEGMVTGAIQVPPEGLPVLFLADHPVTGGYPVIATVIAEDLDIAAQLAPGQTLRLSRVEDWQTGESS